MRRSRRPVARGAELRGLGRDAWSREVAGRAEGTAGELGPRVPGLARACGEAALGRAWAGIPGPARQGRAARRAEVRGSGARPSPGRGASPAPRWGRVGLRALLPGRRRIRGPDGTPSGFAPKRCVLGGGAY